MNAQVYVVPAGLWVMNRATGETSPTTSSKCFVVSEGDGIAQYPVDEKKLCRSFSNRDGTNIRPDNFKMGKRYPVMKREEQNELVFA